MLVRQILTGGDRNYAYVVADEESRLALIIDPSYAPERVFEFITRNKLKVYYVLNTHRHHDHSNGNETMLQLSGVEALAFGDADPRTDKRIEQGAVFPMGSLNIHILHTPGHTEDSICILVNNAVFTGDTLFVGKVGGTGYGEDARQEYDSIHEKLMTLPDETRIFPGHNVGVQPSSTVANERETNPFLQQPDFESFVELKRNWLEYKRKHGIA